LSNTLGNCHKCPRTFKKRHRFSHVRTILLCRHCPHLSICLTTGHSPAKASLTKLKQRQDRGQLHDDDKTILMILDLAGLDLSTLVKQGTEQNREQRQFDLDDAGVSLTKDIEDRWNQRKYEVQFRADGQQFYTFVKDEKDRHLFN